MKIVLQIRYINGPYCINECENLKGFRLFLLVFLTGFSATSTAASLAPFVLSESNLTLGSDFDHAATVTISDGAMAGDIKFVVAVNDAYFNKGPMFGIQSFYFNSSLTIDSSNIVLPGNANWGLLTDFGTAADAGIGLTGFGLFDAMYGGSRNIRQDPLEFTIRADGDNLMSYALDNTAGFAFGVRIEDFSNVPGATGGLFATSAQRLALPSETPPPVSAVPVPAAIWLFGTALIGFIGFSRRTAI